MEKYLYLGINIGTILVPFLASFYPKHAFYKHWKSYFIANAVVATFFILWDSYFTQIGVWGFNPTYVTGYYLYNLPIEEVLFFICIPYASVFIYFSMQYFFENKIKDASYKYVTLTLIVVLLSVFIVNTSKYYTASTALFLSIFLIVMLLRKENMKFIYLSYLVTLIPFFIVNGILTGSWIKSPVVWYNNNHNLSIRLGTIPIEDVFYGFLLVAWVAVLTRRMKKL